MSAGEMRYTMVLKQSPENYAAYAPELPGWSAQVATRDEVVAEIRRAIEFHIESLRERSEPAPPARSTAVVVDVAA